MGGYLVCLLAASSIADDAVLTIGNCSLSVTPGASIIQSNCPTQREQSLQAQLDAQAATIRELQQAIAAAPPRSPAPSTPPLSTRASDVIWRMCAVAANDGERLALLRHLFLWDGHQEPRGVRCIGTSAFYILDVRGGIMFAPEDAQLTSSAVVAEWQMQGSSDHTGGSSPYCQGPVGGNWAPMFGPGTTHPTGLTSNWWYHLGATTPFMGRTFIASPAKSTGSSYWAGSYSGSFDASSHGLLWWNSGDSDYLCDHHSSCHMCAPFGSAAGGTKEMALYFSRLEYTRTSEWW
jgi:hypothetical protein